MMETARENVLECGFSGAFALWVIPPKFAILRSPKTYNMPFQMLRPSLHDEGEGIQLAFPAALTRVYQKTRKNNGNVVLIV